MWTVIWRLSKGQWTVERFADKAKARAVFDELAEESGIEALLVQVLEEVDK